MRHILGHRLFPPQKGNQSLIPRRRLCWGCCLIISIGVTISITITIIIIIVIIVPSCNEHCTISLRHAPATLPLGISANYLGSPGSGLFKQSPRKSPIEHQSPGFYSNFCSRLCSGPSFSRSPLHLSWPLSLPFYFMRKIFFFFTNLRRKLIPLELGTIYIFFSLR